MVRTGISLSIVVGLAVSAALAQTAYDFEPLPEAVEGVPVGLPVALANDGAVLTTAVGGAAIYSRGTLDFVALPPPSELPTAMTVTVADFNASRTLVANYWSFTYPYGGYAGYGFTQDRKGRQMIAKPAAGYTRVLGINESNVAVGELMRPCPPEICGECVFETCFPPLTVEAVIIEDGEARPLGMLGPGNSGAIAIDDRGRILAWRAAELRREHVLLDGDRITDIRLPGELGSMEVFLLDLNNRGQVLGTAYDPQSGVRHAFVLEPDGAYRLVEWLNHWPESFVEELSSGEMIFELQGSPTTFVYGINDHGEVLASTSALYRGHTLEFPGLTVSRGKGAFGVGRPVRRGGARRATARP